MRIIYTTLLALIFIGSPVHAGDGTKLIEQFVSAFNQKDVDKMLTLAAPDMRWMSVSGQEVMVQTATQAELRDAMSGYFNSTPSARSKIRSIRESGPFVYALEQAFWTSNGVETSQCSMAIYELKGDKVKNVWYFPEHQCE